MRICLPVDSANGLDSEIFPNFRAAPALLIVDLESKQWQASEVGSSACQATPTQIDAIICAGGLGRGQFNGLRQRGILVFNSQAMTVMEALQDLVTDNLEEVTEDECCGGHDHAHGAHQHQTGGCGCGSHGHAHGTEHRGCGCGNH